MTATFRSWLVEQHERDDAVGDLSRDTIADQECWVGQSARDLRAHLILFHDVQPDALRALDAAALSSGSC